MPPEGAAEVGRGAWGADAPSKDNIPDTDESRTDGGADRGSDFASCQ